MSDDEQDEGLAFGLRTTLLVLLIAALAFVGGCVVTSLMERVR